jgi:hypothetical protein
VKTTLGAIFRDPCAVGKLAQIDGSCLNSLFNSHSCLSVPLPLIRSKSARRSMPRPIAPGIACAHSKAECGHRTSTRNLAAYEPRLVCIVQRRSVRCAATARKILSPSKFRTVSHTGRADYESLGLSSRCRAWTTAVVSLVRPLRARHPQFGACPRIPEVDCSWQLRAKVKVRVRRLRFNGAARAFVASVTAIAANPIRNSSGARVACRSLRRVWR